MYECLQIFLLMTEKRRIIYTKLFPLSTCFNYLSNQIFDKQSSKYLEIYLHILSCKKSSEFISCLSSQQRFLHLVSCRIVFYADRNIQRFYVQVAQHGTHHRITAWLEGTTLGSSGNLFHCSFTLKVKMCICFCSLPLFLLLGTTKMSLETSSDTLPSLGGFDKFPSQSCFLRS